MKIKSRATVLNYPKSKWMIIRLTSGETKKQRQHTTTFEPYTGHLPNKRTNSSTNNTKKQNKKIKKKTKQLKD